ncbi:MAG: type II secretion system protein [Clostridia bacterium]|nr:type II secretion system protein [Clostridia bacterium]
MKNNNLSKNRSGLSSCKGITLVEVVVALTIISIISVAAFSLIMSSMDLENDMMRDVEISAAADDALDCFIFAETEEKFAEGMDALGYTCLPEDNLYLCYGNGYVIKVSCGDNSMEFVAEDDADVVIFKQKYTKG